MKRKTRDISSGNQFKFTLFEKDNSGRNCIGTENGYLFLNRVLAVFFKYSDDFDPAINDVEMFSS